MGVQKPQKQIVSKRFYKKIDQKSKTDFFLIFFLITFLGLGVSMRGVQKHDKKNIEKINLTLVLFCTLTHPPAHHQKKIDGPPRTFAKSQTHPPTIRLFFS
jgi:hypothetical protein